MNWEAENYFRGQVGDARIYDRALTNDELARFYWLYRWYYLVWWERVFMMVREVWLILTGREMKGGFDFWWTPYNKIVYKKVKG